MKVKALFTGYVLLLSVPLIEPREITFAEEAMSIVADEHRHSRSLQTHDATTLSALLESQPYLGRSSNALVVRLIRLESCVDDGPLDGLETLASS